MAGDDDHFWDALSTDEAQFVDCVIRELRDVPWARALLRNIENGGGLTRANKALFFELRFGHALHQSGITPQYEVAGEADSTLDFGFTSQGRSWLVEAMRLEETGAAQRATQTQTDENGTLWSGRMLSTNADDRRESEEGETLKAVERICQKCERNGRPYKFPVPDGSLRAILIDFRTFLNGGDEYDRIHVGLGGAYVPKEHFRRYWEGKLITGVFDTGTSVRGAAEIRQRVHFLGFVCERSYGADAFGPATQFVANPHLFADAGAARAALASWPLQPVKILNADGRE